MTTPRTARSDKETRGRKLLWTVSTAALVLAIIALLMSQVTTRGDSGTQSTPCPTATIYEAAAGLSAYELWKSVGNKGTLDEFLKSLVGEPGADGTNGTDGTTIYIGTNGITPLDGDDGASAYQLWLDAGNEGSADDFLASLEGADGAEGPSAYSIWLALGNEGKSEQDFIDALTGDNGTNGTNGTDGTNGTNGLNGINGESAYDLWHKYNADGDELTFLNSLIGPPGPSGAPGASGIPGQCAIGNIGPTGNPGADGADGLSAYQVWLAQPGNTGSPTDFFNSLHGPQGEKGAKGDTGSVGPAGPTGPTGPAGPTFSPSTVSYVMGGGTVNFGSTVAQQPTFSGQPQFYGNYVQVGDLVYFNVWVDMSNITYFGRGQYFVTLPFNSRYAYSTRAGRVIDEGASHDYALNGFVDAGSNVLLLTYDSGSSQAEFDYNSPITLAPTAEFYISGSFIKQ